MCDHLAKSIEALEAYSYQFNIKIVRVPLAAERETSQHTADCYIKLFCALGFHDVSLNIIGTAYQSDAVHRCSQ